MKDLTTGRAGRLFESSGDSVPGDAEGNCTHRLGCMEVWGTNARVSTAIELPGLSTWVYSNPLGSGGGGDLHYMSVCGNGDLSRVVLADVSGHGEQASSAATFLQALMRSYIDLWDQADVMRELNRVLWREWRGRHYASAVILGYRRSTGELAFTNAGHPPPLWRRTPENSWVPLNEHAPDPVTGVVSTPAGLLLDAEYSQTILRLAVGDSLLLYTDGLTEAVNDKGEDLGWPAFLEAARSAPVGSPQALGQAVLDTVDDFRHGAAPIDDQTLMIIERSNEEQPAAGPLAIRPEHSSPSRRQILGHGGDPTEPVPNPNP